LFFENEVTHVWDIVITWDVVDQLGGGLLGKTVGNGDTCADSQLGYRNGVCMRI
jgi:hypothetical protein